MGSRRQCRISGRVYYPVLDMSDTWRGNHLHRQQRGIADVLKQPLSSSEDDRHDVQVKFVQQTCDQILLYRARAAGNRDVTVAGRS